MAPSKDEWPSDSEDKWVHFFNIEGLNLKGGGQFDGEGSFWWKHCYHKQCKRPTVRFKFHFNFYIFQ